MAPAAPIAPTGEGEGVISGRFKDAEVAEVLDLIATQGNVEITINEDVQGKLRLMTLQDQTPEEAIRRVAMAARLQWRKIGPNSYIVAKELPPEIDGPTVAPISPSIPAYTGGPSVTFVQPPAYPTADVLPDLANSDADRNGNEKREYKRILIKNISSRQIAWMLDPQNQPEPLIFSISRQNQQNYAKQYLGQSAFSPETLAAQNGNYIPPSQYPNPYGLSGNNGGGDGGGFNQFSSAYTQGNAQFGGGGGGFGGNQGGRGGRNGGRNGNQNGNQNGGRNGGRNGNQNGGGNGGNGGGGVFELPEGVDSITAVDAQNALLVFSTAEGFSRLQDIVNFLDLPLRQVEIEAQFVAVNTNDTNSLGIDFSTSNGPFTATANGFQPGPPSSGGSFQLGFIRGNFQASLRALLLQNRAKVVTAPRILAINNLTASLSSNTSTPIITTQTQAGIGGNIATGNQVNFITSGISLTVTPTINLDDTVTVVLQPQVQQQTQVPGIAVPGVVSQSLQTVAIVRDGDTIALGGLRTQNLGNTLQQVPLLARIPIIGALFRRKEQTKTDQDLIIFLTARIVRQAPVIADAVPGT